MTLFRYSTDVYLLTSAIIHPDNKETNREIIAVHVDESEAMLAKEQYEHTYARHPGSDGSTKFDVINTSLLVSKEWLEEMEDIIWPT